MAIPFGLTMILLAPMGTWLNIQLPTGPVIAIFALFTASAALLMLSGWRPKRGALTPIIAPILVLVGARFLWMVL